MTTWTREALLGRPGEFLYRLGGEDRVMLSVLSGPGVYPLAIADRVLAALNAPSNVGDRNLECIRRGWTGAAHYDAERATVEALLTDQPPEVMEAVRNAWSRGGFADHILDRREMSEWFDTVAACVAAHHAQDNVA